MRECDDGVRESGLLAIVVVGVLLGVGLVAMWNRQPDTLAAVAARVPTEVAGLRATGPVETFLPSTVASHLDRGAEILLAYGMQACVSRRYQGAAGELTLDLFEMTSSADAFGVFSCDRRGERLDVGQGARLRRWSLSAWRGAFYVAITADRSDGAARRALVELGSAVTAAIGHDGRLPALVRDLPADGLERDSVAYAHDHVTLAALVALPDGNPLELSRTTEVAVGRYGLGGAAVTLVVVGFPAADAARAGAERLARAWGVTPGAPALYGGSRWRMAGARGRRVAVVLSGADEASARALAEAALGGPPTP